MSADVFAYTQEYMYTDGREVDFVVVDKRKPIMLVECKFGDAPLDKSLRYLRSKFPDCPAWQVHFDGQKDDLTPERIRVAPAMELLRDLA